MQYGMQLYAVYFHGKSLGIQTVLVYLPVYIQQRSASKSLGFHVLFTIRDPELEPDLGSRAEPIFKVMLKSLLPLLKCDIPVQKSKHNPMK